MTPHPNSSRTLSHYEANAAGFWEGTKDHDVSQNYEALLDTLDGPGPFTILDFGCGPGRDLAHFASLGHQAVGLDGCSTFCAMARRHSGCEVLEQDFLALALPARPVSRRVRERLAVSRAQPRPPARAR